MLASIIIIFVDSGLKTSVSDFLKLLSLSSALLLIFLLYYYRVTYNFLKNELYTKGYLPPLTKQATKAFYIAVYYLPIDLYIFKAFL